MPTYVISPYAKSGVLSTPYNMASVVRSVETILGLPPMNLFDAQATPMYDAFTGTPNNNAAFNALQPTYNILEQNPAPASAAARATGRYNTTIPDQIPQRLLDRALWKSVHGPHSKPPPPGPGAITGG